MLLLEKWLHLDHSFLLKFRLSQSVLALLIPIKQKGTVQFWSLKKVSKVVQNVQRRLIDVAQLLSKE